LITLSAGIGVYWIIKMALRIIIFSPELRL